MLRLKRNRGRRARPDWDARVGWFAVLLLTSTWLWVCFELARLFGGLGPRR